MITATFEPSNAGAQLQQQVFGAAEGFQNLFARAEAIKQSREKLDMEKKRFVDESLMAAANRDQAAVNLAQTRLRLENEQKVSARKSSLLKEWDEQGAAGFASDFQTVRNVTDPAMRKRAIVGLHSKYAKFAELPEAANFLSGQIKQVDDEVTGQLSSSFYALNASGMLFPDVQTAQALYPGRRVMQVADPVTGARQFTVTDEPDLQLAMRATQKIHAVIAGKGDPASLAADEDIALISQFPKSAPAQLWTELQKTSIKTAGEVAVKNAELGAGKSAPSELIVSTEKLQNSYNDLQGIKAEYDKNEGLWTGPVMGLFKDLNPWDTDAVVLSKKLTAAVPTLARGVFGEVGVLTDTDMKTYKSLLPNVRSPKAAADVLFKFLSDKLERTYNQRLKVLKGQGYRTTGFDPKLGGAESPADSDGQAFSGDINGRPVKGTWQTDGKGRKGVLGTDGMFYPKA